MVQPKNTAKSVITKEIVSFEKVQSKAAGCHSDKIFATVACISMLLHCRCLDLNISFIRDFLHMPAFLMATLQGE